MLNIFIRKLVNLFNSIHQRSTYELMYQKYGVSEKFFFQGVDSEVYGDGEFKVGQNSYCGNRCAFQTAIGYEIKIGSNVAISHNVRIYTSNRSSQYITVGKEPKYSFGSVSIGDNVWIGANVFIKEGVIIGDNVVIGANSVVTKNVGSKSIIGGVPAKALNK